MELLAINYWDYHDVFREKLGPHGSFITIGFLQCAYFNETFDQYFFRCVEHMQLDFQRAMHMENCRLSADYLVLFRKEWLRLDKVKTINEHLPEKEEKAPLPSSSLLQLDDMEMMEGAEDSSSDSPVVVPAPRDRRLQKVHKFCQILEDKFEYPTGFITRAQVLEFCHRMHYLHGIQSWKINKSEIKEMERELFRGNKRISLMDFCLYAERVENYLRHRDIDILKCGKIKKIKQDQVPAFNPEVSSWEQYMNWCTSHLAIDLFWLGINPTFRSARSLDLRRSSVKERSELAKEAAQIVRGGWTSLDDDELGVLPKAKIRKLTSLLVEILEPPYREFPLRLSALFKRNAATRLRREWPSGVWNDVMTFWDFVTTLSADIGPLVTPTSRTILPTHQNNQNKCVIS